MSEQELEQINPQELVDQALTLKKEAAEVEAKYEDEKKAAHEKHKSVTSRIKELVQPLYDEITIIKDMLGQWRSSNANQSLNGCTFRQGKFEVISSDLAALVKAAAENPALLRYLSLNEKSLQKTLDDREDLHGVPGIVAKRGPDVVVLKGDK